jgi:hypothetical protein
MLRKRATRPPKIHSLIYGQMIELQLRTKLLNIKLATVMLHLMDPGHGTVGRNQHGPGFSAKIMLHIYS